MNNTPLLLIGILLIGIVWCVKTVDSTIYDTGTFGSTITIEDTSFNLSSVNLTYPAPNATTNPSWHNNVNGDINISIRIYGDQAVFYRVYYFNRTGDTWTLINTSNLVELTDTYLDFNYTWSGLGDSTSYDWIVNVSYNKTESTIKWWNVSSNQSIGYWRFTTTSYSGPIYTATFGSTITIEDVFQIYDTATYGSTITIEDTGGNSSNSTWWEFYKIEFNRYNVFEPTINETDTFDVYAVYYEVYYSEPYDYLYDVFEPDEETVDTFDVYRVYYYAYYGEEP